MDVRPIIDEGVEIDQIADERLDAGEAAPVGAERPGVAHAGVGLELGVPRGRLMRHVAHPVGGGFANWRPGRNPPSAVSHWFREAISCDGVWASNSRKKQQSKQSKKAVHGRKPVIYSRRLLVEPADHVTF